MSERGFDGSAEVYVRKTLSPAVADRFVLKSEHRPRDLDDAYRRVRDATQMDSGFGAAWKLGGTTARTRTAFRIDKVYFGCLHTNEILRQPAAVSLGHLCELKGEVEIALRLSARLNELTEARVRDARYRNLPVRNLLFDSWCFALEMPASAILNLVESGITALIADRCAAGCLILGPENSPVLDSWDNFAPIVLSQGADVVARGDVKHLLGSPVDCAIEFCLEALSHGFVLRPGQWISTGGLTPCVSLQCGRCITVRHGETVVLEFELLP